MKEGQNNISTTLREVTNHVRIWLVSSALESVEGRVWTAHTTITSREWQQYSLLSVTRLWVAVLLSCYCTLTRDEGNEFFGFFFCASLLRLFFLSVLVVSQHTRCALMWITCLKPWVISKHIEHYAAHISHVDSHPDTRCISSCVIVERCRSQEEHKPSAADCDMRHARLSRVIWLGLRKDPTSTWRGSSHCGA